eukprot:c7768_g1_i1.p2 GENE.c7768_g1_i1~~c7768_g1_i1.p2  ORF type:complete len:154 (+),score=27.29 c7768_g1_i1:107-568(+)
MEDLTQTINEILQQLLEDLKQTTSKTQAEDLVRKCCEELDLDGADQDLVSRISSFLRRTYTIRISHARHGDYVSPFLAYVSSIVPEELPAAGRGTIASQVAAFSRDFSTTATIPPQASDMASRSAPVVATSVEQQQHGENRDLEIKRWNDKQT